MAESNSSGTITGRYHYQPFGQRIEAYPADDLGYTGHQHDSTLGLTYAQARYLDQGVGRFLSNDPKGFDANNVQSFNRYAYGNNNPYKYVDPDGNESREQMKQNIRNAGKHTGVSALQQDNSSQCFANAQKATDVIKSGVAAGKIKAPFLKDVSKIAIRYVDKSSPANTETTVVKGQNDSKVDVNGRIESIITIYKEGAETLKDAAATIGHEIGHSDPADFHNDKESPEVEAFGNDVADQVCKQEEC